MRTFLVDDLVCRCLPFLLVEDFDDNDVSMDSSVHVLAADEKDGFGEGWNRDTALRERRRREMGQIECDTWKDDL